MRLIEVRFIALDIYYTKSRFYKYKILRSKKIRMIDWDRWEQKY